MYDFTDKNRKKIIEYQGDMYHANPHVYESYDNPHPFKKDKISKEIWEHDKRKKERAEKDGYEVIYIWDSEYRKDKEFIIDKCINFIKG